MNEKQKKVAIMLHGFVGDKHQYDKILKAIDDNVKCYNLNAPGTGGETPLEKSSLQAYFEWLDAWITTILAKEGVRQVCLIGFSFSAVLISRYLREFNDNRVAEVFMISPVARRRFKKAVFYFAYLVMKFLSVILPEKAMQWIFWKFDWEHTEHGESTIMNLKLSCMSAVSISRVRTFFVIGDKDQFTKEKDARVILENSTTDYVVISGAEHYCFMNDYSLELAELINNFINPRE